MKCMFTWSGLWSLVMQGEHACTLVMQDMSTKQQLNVHMPRMHPYAEKSLHVTEELQEVISRMQGHGKQRMIDELNIVPGGAAIARTCWIHFLQCSAIFCSVNCGRRASHPR